MSHELPDESPVVLFDGVCNLCTGTVQFIVPRDADGTLKFATLQSEVGQALLSAMDLPTEDFDSIVLVEDGDYYTKSTAALRIAGHLDGLWRLLAGLRVVPKPIRDAVYDLVANTRYQVFGRKDQCMMPTPDLEARFLD